MHISWDGSQLFIRVHNSTPFLRYSTLLSLFFRLLLLLSTSCFQLPDEKLLSSSSITVKILSSSARHEFFFLWSFPDYIYSRGSRRSRCVSESNGNLKELSLLSTHLIGCLLLIDGSTYFFLKKSTAQPGQKLPHFLLCFLLSHSQ